MSTFEVEYSNERILSNSGMALVGAILEQGGFREALNQLDVTDKRSGNQIKDGDLMSVYWGFAVWAGRISRRFVRWTATRNFMSFVWAWRVRLRKQPCARGCIIREAILKANTETLRRNGARASPLSNGYVPVDMDVTPFDNSNALYKSLTDAPLLFRMDSGNDAAENMGILLRENCRFLVNRNLRKESKEAWLEQIRENCQDIERPIEGNAVYIGSTWRETAIRDSHDAEKAVTLQAVYEITERTIDKYGQILLVPDVEVIMINVV